MPAAEPYTIELIGNEPIIRLVATSAWRVDAHFESMAKRIIDLLQLEGRPCYLIADVRELSVTVEDLARGANMAARANNAVLRHPFMTEFLIVTSSRLLALAGRGLGSDVFGNIKVRVFTTVDDALAYARDRIAAM